MVRKTFEGKERPPEKEDGWDDSDHDLIEEHPPFFRGSPEEQYLRNRSSYLAPGALGKIKLGYRFVLGMGLNLGFIVVAVVAAAVPLALFYGLLYPALIAHVVGGGLCRRLFPGPNGKGVYRDTLCELLPLRIPTALWITVGAVAVVAILLGGASIVAYRWRAWATQVTEVWSLRLLILAAVAGFTLIGLPVLLSLFRAWGTVIPSATKKLTGGVVLPNQSITPAHASGSTTAIVAGAGGAVTLGGAVLLQLRADWTEARKLASDLGGVAKWYGKLAPWVRRALAYAIAALIGPALTLAVALEAMTSILNVTHPWVRWLVTGGVLGFFLLIYICADMTTWSLHSFYRRRLCSAFALKRISRQETGHPAIASTNAGEAEQRDYREQVTLSKTAISAGADGHAEWPTLLVCAAANVSDSAATPPGRAVTSFTFSSTAMGGPLIGAVKTADLEQVWDPKRLSYITLPAAVAMSGAALSPSMGKMTRGPLRFLMALANVRLGVWVPNPRLLDTFSEIKAHVDEQVEASSPSQTAGGGPRDAGGDGRRGRRRFVKRHYPRPRASYLLCELLGMNRLNAPYLYVTDGGHYENLGLVELLRRGCTEIYCFDASNDNFNAIGDAVSLARSELGVEVKVNYQPLQVDAESGRAKTNCVTADIIYPGTDTPKATLYYARLVMTETTPPDAVAYHGTDPHFPHDPTTDQLYTDQRFEAYRALGANAASTAVSLAKAGGGRRFRAVGLHGNGAEPAATLT
jgi:hypothetical protein